MSTLQLTWSKIYLSSTEIVGNSEEADSLHLLQWYTASTTLMILKRVGEESLTIDLRADTELESVMVSECQLIKTFISYLCCTMNQYHEPSRTRNHAVIYMKIIPSRPFAWAENTTLDPMDPQNNQIVCEVDLLDDEDHEAYEALTTWLKHHMITGGATIFPEDEGTQTLEELFT
jgi:hypothetical protein